MVTWKLNLGDAKLTIESPEIHEILVDSWAKSLVHAWQTVAKASPVHSPATNIVPPNRTSRQTVIPKLTAKQDYKLVRNWIECKLSPPWDKVPTAKDRAAVRKFVREHLK